MAVTFANADSLAIIVYRGPSGSTPVANIGSGANDIVGSATVRYGAGTLSTLGGTSRVAGFASHATATNLATAPTGMTNVASSSTPKEAVVHHDPAGRTSNWPATDVTVNASGIWRSWVLEIKNVTSYVAATATLGDTFTYPAATAVGDLVIVMHWRYSSSSASAPSGWTTLNSASATLLTSSGAWKIITTTDLPSAFVPQISVY